MTKLSRRLVALLSPDQSDGPSEATSNISGLSLFRGIPGLFIADTSRGQCYASGNPATVPANGPLPAINARRDTNGPPASNRGPYVAAPTSGGNTTVTFQTLSGTDNGAIGYAHGGAASPPTSIPASVPLASSSRDGSVPPATAAAATLGASTMTTASNSAPTGASLAETTLVQAASAAASVTLINATPVTQNPDGSTSVFGDQGNAIENVNPDAVTVFADPLATADGVPIPIWYAPAATVQYFQNILDNPQMFSTIAGGIAVFKMYGQMASWPDATLQAFFAYLSQNNIKLGIETGALVAGPGQPGYGIEGFLTPGGLNSILTRIKMLGGTVSYVAWDEPLYYGNITTGIYTVAQLAAQAAVAAGEVAAVFPDAQIGDIEPVGNGGTDATGLQAWFTAYAQATGTPLKFFQADLAPWTPTWQAQLASTITTVHANKMSMGVVIDGIGAADNDNAWATQAVANAQLILSDPVLRPDYLIVQSWQTDPSEAGDPGVPGTLASVAADVAASENAALAVTAVAQYDAAGLLQNVTWTGRLDGNPERQSVPGDLSHGQRRLPGSLEQCTELRIRSGYRDRFADRSRLDVRCRIGTGMEKRNLLDRRRREWR